MLVREKMYSRMSLTITILDYTFLRGCAKKNQIRVMPLEFVLPGIS